MRASSGSRRRAREHAARPWPALAWLAAVACALPGCGLFEEQGGEPPPPAVAAADYRPAPRTLSLDPADQATQRPDELLLSAIEAPRIQRPRPLRRRAAEELPVSALPGLARPCARARGFTVYGRGLPIRSVDAVCEQPPGAGPRRRPRINEVRIGYGACIAGSGPRCPRRLTITSAPSCERPHAFLHGSSLSRRGPIAHAERRWRRVPTAVLRGGRTVVLFTKRTTITVTSDDVGRTADAARTAMPAPGTYAPEPSRYAALPAPSGPIGAARLQRTLCAA